MSLRPLEIFYFYFIYKLESDVYRRRILTYKDGPHTVKIKGHNHVQFKCVDCMVDLPRKK